MAALVAPVVSGMAHWQPVQQRKAVQIYSPMRMGLKTIISLNFTLTSTGDAALLYSTLKSCSWKIDMHASLTHVHATDTT